MVTGFREGDQGDLKAGNERVTQQQKHTHTLIGVRRCPAFSVSLEPPKLRQYKAQVNKWQIQNTYLQYKYETYTGPHSKIHPCVGRRRLATVSHACGLREVDQGDRKAGNRRVKQTKIIVYLKPFQNMSISFLDASGIVPVQQSYFNG